MASKKIPVGFNPAEAELEHRVEAMMEPVKITVIDHTDLVDPVAAAVKKPGAKRVMITMSHEVPAAGSAALPIDIFSDPKTAPAVPADLLEKLTASVAEPDNNIEPALVIPAEVPTTAAVLPATKAKPELPPALPTVVNRVPQLIASTAPKPNEVKAAAEDIAFSTPDAAPEFITDNNPTADDPTIDVPPLELDDLKTDAAIASIAASESDELLAAQDAVRDQQAAGPITKVAKSSSPGRHKLWLILVFLLLFVAAILAVPYSRYKVAGLVVKQTVQLQVVDSKTGRPVSKAVIEANGQISMSDAAGNAQFKLPVGTNTVTVRKQYYTSSAVDTFTGFKIAAPFKVSLLATGRQVPINVTNALTGKPLAGAEITLSKTSARTDSQGKAIIVLPADQKTLIGSISASGYNKAGVTVQVSDTAIAANAFKLVPSGSVYVLSNSSGTIDIIKTNLDGSQPTTVLKGSGKEDANSTVLLASRDWKYLVLKAQRDSTQAAMYMLDTSNDKLVEFDSGDANFTPIGWSGHTFMYDAVRNNIATSQNNHEQIKSYDAERGQLNQLDSTQAASASVGFSFQGFYNFNLVDNLLVYNTQWYSSGGADISTKNATIRAVQSNGQGKKDYQNISAAGLAYIQAAQVAPNAVYYATFNFSDNKNQYYAFQNQSVSSPSTVNAGSFNKVFPAYVVSPSGKQTLWNETRDGKQVVLVGDLVAANARPLPTLTGFSVYGWYSDDYLLVSKNRSQLFIVPTDGVTAPVAITNYYKPGQNVMNIIYGYGGL